MMPADIPAKAWSNAWVGKKEGGVEVVAGRAGRGGGGRGKGAGEEEELAIVELEVLMLMVVLVVWSWLTCGRARRRESDLLPEKSDLYFGSSVEWCRGVQEVLPCCNARVECRTRI